MVSIDIKNRLFTLFAKLVNIFDFDCKRLSIEKARSGETCIYYIIYYVFILCIMYTMLCIMYLYHVFNMIKILFI